MFQVTGGCQVKDDLERPWHALLPLPQAEFRSDFSPEDWVGAEELITKAEADGLTDDLIERIQDWWDENGKSRERLGELIKRLGMRVFLRAVGLPAVAQMVKAPRTNPYVFFWPEEIKKEVK